MPDYSNTSYYYAKFANISKISLKNIPYRGESFSDFLSQCNVSLSALNLNTLEMGTRSEHFLQQYETHQKRHYCQPQRSRTSHTDTKLCAHQPEVIAICGKPGTKNPNWQDFNCAQWLKQVKSVSPVKNYITEEPTDGSSTSKSSSSCDRSDIWHSSRTSNRHSQKNSKGPNNGNTNDGSMKCQNGGNQARKKGVKHLESQEKNPTFNSNCCAHKCRPCEDENYKQPHKLRNSEYPHLHMSPTTGVNKKHSDMPVASKSKLPHDKVACQVMPHQNSTQNTELLAKPEEGDNANYQIDTNKYDDMARLEIFKLRNRIKRYTEGSDNPMLRKYHTARAQNLNSPAGKILKSKTQSEPYSRISYQGLSFPKSQVQCTKHPPLIHKSVPQMLHTAPVKKKRRNFEIGAQVPEKQTVIAKSTASSDISSTASDSRSRESSSNISIGTQPYIRVGTTQLGTKRNVYRKENSSAKSLPQHTQAKSQMDTAEQCTKLYQGNCQIQPKTLKRSQLRRPVPGQRPLYNYDQLPYQASEVYPDLICELEEKLSAINSQHGSGKSVSHQSK